MEVKKIRVLQGLYHFFYKNHCEITLEGSPLKKIFRNRNYF